MTVVANYHKSAFYPVGGAQYTSLSVFHDSVRSPRVNGKLQLRANPWSLSVVSSTRTNWHSGGPAPFVYPSFAATTNDPRILRARAVAESDIRGVLARKIKNKEVGALGVSIATSAKSIELMKGSSDSLISIFAAAERFYRTARGKKRAKRFRRLIARGAEPTAGMVLAGFFGWAPLLEDFRQAANTLANPWPNTSYVSAKRKWDVGTFSSLTVGLSGFEKRTSTWSATGHSAYSCGVSVSNPNLWVANKLGLVNLAGIAWDLVPWSFLVNMVSNMGQVMGSLTDFAGVALSNTSLTTALTMSESSSVLYTDPRPKASSGGQGVVNTKIRGRLTQVAPPSVVPYFRFPEWGVGTAAIVGALLVQQAGRLTRAFSTPT